MCDEDSNGVGGIVPNDLILYRGCTRSSFLNGAKDEINEIAFFKEGKNHTNGLSLSLTAEGSIKDLNSYGVVSVLASEIKRLRPALEIRYDISDPADCGHVLIRNMPCYDRENEREDAEALAAELVVVSTIVSTQRIKKK